MAPDELDAVGALGVAAFDDPMIGDSIAGLHDSWAWVPELSFVAEQDGALLGHVCYSHAILDAPDRLVEVLVLGPLSVHPDHHRRGIGTHLVSETLAILHSRSEPLVFVEGDPAYYGRFGFGRASDFGFTRPSIRTPLDAFQVVTLPAYEPWMTGALVYPDIFWRFDAVGLRG